MPCLWFLEIHVLCKRREQHYGLTELSHLQTKINTDTGHRTHRPVETVRKINRKNASIYMFAFTFNLTVLWNIEPVSPDLEGLQIYTCTAGYSARPAPAATANPRPRGISLDPRRAKHTRVGREERERLGVIGRWLKGVFLYA